MCRYFVQNIISIGNNMTCSDFRNKYQKLNFKIKLLYVISQAIRRVKFDTILKYYE